MNSLQILEQASVQALQGTETINYYGFPKTRPKQTNPKVKNLTQERLEVSNRAQQIGFMPLAIVPIKFLHAAFKKFGLYWFEEIDKQGKVAVNLNKEENLLNKIDAFLKRWDGSSLSFLGCLYVSAIGIILLMGALMFIEGTKVEPKDLWWWRSLLFWAAANCCLYILAVVFNEIGSARVKLKILFLKTFFFPKKYLFKLLFTGERGPARLTLYFNISSDIFAHNLKLIRQNKLQPCVAAVPEAINVSRKELRQVINKERARLAEEERRRKELEADPILYYLDGNYAVIVAQHGEFAKEKQLLKWAKKHGPSWWLN